MNSPGLPPHIGAWCEGKAGDNFAYVSFLPNILHDVPRIPMLAAEWAKRRAESMVNLLDAAGLGRYGEPRVSLKVGSGGLTDSWLELLPTP